MGLSWTDITVYLVLHGGNLACRAVSVALVVTGTLLAPTSGSKASDLTLEAAWWESIWEPGLQLWLGCLHHPPCPVAGTSAQMELLKEEAAEWASDCSQCWDLSPGQDSQQVCLQKVLSRWRTSCSSWLSWRRQWEACMASGLLRKS